MSAGPGFAQQVIQAGYGLGFGGPDDPRRRIARPDWTGSAGATPAMARPQPAGVGGEAVADPGQPRNKSMSDVFWNETNIGGALKGVYDAVTLPRDVYEGKIDPRSEEGIERAFDLAGNVTLGAGAIPAEAGALRAGASVFHGAMDPSQMTAEMQALSKKYTGMTKPRGDVTQTTASYIDKDELQPVRTLDPQTLKGATLIGAPGDRTWSGHDLTAINGRDLNYSVPLIGGEGYMRHKGNDHGWASARQAIDPQVKGAQEALEKGSRPILAYGSMGPRSGDYSTMNADALLAQIPGYDIDPVLLNRYNAQVREQYPKWAGIENTADARAQILAPGAGNLRKAVLETADTAKYQDPGGLPNVAATRWAATAPDLRLSDENRAGYSMAQVDGVKGMSEHPAYPLSIGGDYIGGMPEGGIPKDLMFPDWVNNRRARGQGQAGDRRSFETNIPYQRQLVDDQWIENVMKWYESQKGRP